MLPDFHFGRYRESPADASALVSPVHDALSRDVDDLVFKPFPVCLLSFLFAVVL